MGGQVTPSLPGCLNWYIKLRGLEAIYGANDGLISDLETGAIYLMLYQDNALVTPAQYPIFVQYSSRLRFYD